MKLAVPHRIKVETNSTWASNRRGKQGRIFFCVGCKLYGRDQLLHECFGALEDADEGKVAYFSAPRLCEILETCSRAVFAKRASPTLNSRYANSEVLTQNHDCSFCGTIDTTTLRIHPIVETALARARPSILHCGSILCSLLSTRIPNRVINLD